MNFQTSAVYIGDNLPILRGMDSGTVDLIATDPPFNSGRTFYGKAEALGANFKDSWSWGDIPNHELERLRTQYPLLSSAVDLAYHASSQKTAAFLLFMTLRLVECRRILKPNGSIYVHCDPSADAYLRMIMDVIFGAPNFRNHIIWKRTHGGSGAKHYVTSHDSILYYGLTDARVWNQQYLPQDPRRMETAFSHEDERGRWAAESLSAPNTSAGESGQPWRGVDPTEVGRHWSTPVRGGMGEFIRGYDIIPDWPDAYPGTRDKLDALDAAGLIYWPPKGRVPQLKRYLESTRGIALEDIITDVSRLAASQHERVGYPTQKPVALYSHFVKSSSNPGDLVLDPFCGSGTTLQAAEDSGRRWVGIDDSPAAFASVVSRLPGAKAIINSALHPVRSI